VVVDVGQAEKLIERIHFQIKRLVKIDSCNFCARMAKPRASIWVEIC
jgi:hypothetical protein